MHRSRRQFLNEFLNMNGLYLLMCQKSGKCSYKGLVHVFAFLAEGLFQIVYVALMLPIVSISDHNLLLDCPINPHC